MQQTNLLDTGWGFALYWLLTLGAALAILALSSFGVAFLFLLVWAPALLAVFHHTPAPGERGR